jgi:hypothetical protein
MGVELVCAARYKGKTTKGKALLETEALEFRAPGLRLSIPFKQITKLTARGGALTVDSLEGPLSLALGDAAEKWAFKIQHPPSRLDKIGVKPDWRVSALGVDDEAFLAELERAVSQLSIGRALKNSDAIFFDATKEADLARLAKVKESLKPNGALWVIRPKAPAAMPARERAGAKRARHQRAAALSPSRSNANARAAGGGAPGAVKDAGPRETLKKSQPEISERAVMAAGKAAGLVDVKVVSFSATHTAEKFVIPVNQRPAR